MIVAMRDTQAGQAVTTKIEVPQKRAVLVGKWIVTAREHQLNRLWREGLCPRALANFRGGLSPPLGDQTKSSI